MIPLKCAVLCAECETISRGRNNQCELCGSQTLLNLSELLDLDSIPASRSQEIAVRIGVA